LGLKNKIIMSFKEFTVNLTSSSNEIILLEGTRKLAESDAPKLIALAQQLATKYPRCIFRTGNATGSDEAFAKGIALVDPTRLEYVLPSHRDGKKEINTTRKNYYFGRFSYRIIAFFDRTKH
jgi:hypothetical protein